MSLQLWLNVSPIAVRALVQAVMTRWAYPNPGRLSSMPGAAPPSGSRSSGCLRLAISDFLANWWSFDRSPRSRRRRVQRIGQQVDGLADGTVDEDEQQGRRCPVEESAQLVRAIPH